MRVLVSAMPFGGHAAPMQALARELAARGHDVVAYTGSRYGQGFRAAGADLITWRHAPDFDDRDLRATFPQVTDGRGPKALTSNVEHVFLRTGGGQARDIVEHGPFDLLVADQLAIGSSLAAETTGTPWASVALVPLGLPSRQLPPFGMALLPRAGWTGRLRDAVLRQMSAAALGRLDEVLDDVRNSIGLPSTSIGALEAFYSSQLVLAHGIPDLEYPRDDLPPQVHFVGQLSTPPAAARLPGWWPEVVEGGRSVVHVTQGTYDVEPRDLLVPALEGLRDLDVQVVAATAGAELPEGSVPANARHAPFLPYPELLPRTAVMVTNGGWGGVLSALSWGVPLVVAGGTLDKPEIARRVAWAGAGVDLRTGTPSPAAVRAAVEHVLADRTFKDRAAGLSAVLGGYGGPSAAADLLERLASTRAPVHRLSPDPWSSRE